MCVGWSAMLMGSHNSIWRDGRHSADLPAPAGGPGRSHRVSGSLRAAAGSCTTVKYFEISLLRGPIGLQGTL